MTHILVTPQPDELNTNFWEFRLGEEDKQFYAPDDPENSDWQLEDILRHCPYKIGMPIPKLEVWKLSMIYYGGATDLAYIEYRDGQVRRYPFPSESCPRIEEGTADTWRPANTLPRKAVRRWGRPITEIHLIRVPDRGRWAWTLTASVLDD